MLAECFDLNWTGQKLTQGNGGQQSHQSHHVKTDFNYNIMYKQVLDAHCQQLACPGRCMKGPRRA